ncbi:MAG: hypothetical protein N3A59_06150 [Thermodesulfovibrionales bacterium]|nr:hypothetical protein [Thermodesulfovibrionales bacterium]
MEIKNLDYQNPKVFLPPLPDVISPEPINESILKPDLWANFKSLRCGCYLIKLTSNINPLLVYDGTIRVECHSNGLSASGDLYRRSIIFYPQISSFKGKFAPFLTPAPNPKHGIPILPRNRYRYYLRVTKILEWFTFSNSFILSFEVFRFKTSSKTWTNEGTFTAQMSWTTAPAGYPSKSDYLEGDVKTAGGKVVGRLTMGWVSSYLRRATIEIDRVSVSESPLNNGAGINWQTIYDQVGWQITVIESNTNVTEPSGEGWSDAELHQTMLNWRDSADLDSQWLYHLLCVRLLDSTERGIMYDCYGGDSNNIPREGAAIASHWMIPNTNKWGLVKGMRFGAASAPYFRTAVHEIGHAQMMFHPSATTGNHIMQVTPQIAENAVPPQQFPDNIEWAFSPDDQRLLRHLPDVVVRPGTVLKFGTDVAPPYTGIPLSPLDLAAEVEGLQLHVTPLLETVPIGAPVRINFKLLNTSTLPIPVPKRLSIKTGHVTGKVIDSSGTERTFSTIIRYLDDAELQMLEPASSINDSLTLLRGIDGSLFQSPGIHNIVITLSWDINGYLVQLSGNTTIMITPPIDVEHSKAALKVITTPDILLILVLGGDHLTDGIDALQVALKSPILRPHFAYIEAKRVAQRFGKRKPNFKAASELITDDTIMSPAEIKKLAKLINKEGADSSFAKTIANSLKRKIKTLDVSEDVKKMVEAL